MSFAIINIIFCQMMNWACIVKGASKLSPKTCVNSIVSERSRAVLFQKPFSSYTYLTSPACPSSFTPPILYVQHLLCMLKLNYTIYIADTVSIDLYKPCAIYITYIVYIITYISYMQHRSRHLRHGQLIDNMYIICNIYMTYITCLHRLHPPQAYISYKTSTMSCAQELRHSTVIVTHGLLQRSC